MGARIHHHRVWAEIDLDALAHNLGQIRKLAGPGVEVMMVLKADAYGHGAVAVAHHAVKHGAEALGVGDSHEALELRAAGVRVPILVLGTVIEDEIPDLLAHHVEIGIHSSDRIRSLNREASKRGTVARVHLNIDTGMGRLGIFPSKAPGILEELCRARSLRLVGMMTHFAAAEGLRNPFTRLQLERFDEALRSASSLGLAIPKIHCANSAALFTGLHPLHNMIRPGIAAYGILPRRLQGETPLKPVLSLKTQIVFLKDHPAGSSIGYNGRYLTPAPTRIATIPVGYNDGVPFRLGNRGSVIVRGRKAPIVGSVSMDYATIDIGRIPGARVGDLVTVLGREGGSEITVEEVARALETIPYEITCAIGKRVRREYIDSSPPFVPERPRRQPKARPASPGPPPSLPAPVPG